MYGYVQTSPRHDLDDDPINEIGMTDDELARAAGWPDGIRPSILVDDLLDQTDRRIAAARGVTRLGV